MRKYDHIAPLLHDVPHKICLLVFLSLHGAAPEYLRICCTGSHASTSGLWRGLISVDGAFSAAGRRCWNSLPPVIRLTDSVDSFKAQFKTHLFANLTHIFRPLPLLHCIHFVEPLSMRTYKFALPPHIKLSCLTKSRI